jgi:hypothetical protein
VQRKFNTLYSILVLVEAFDPRVLCKGSSGANIGKLMEVDLWVMQCAILVEIRIQSNISALVRIRLVYKCCIL